MPRERGPNQREFAQFSSRVRKSSFLNTTSPPPTPQNFSPFSSSSPQATSRLFFASTFVTLSTLFTFRYYSKGLNPLKWTWLEKRGIFPKPSQCRGGTVKDQPHSTAALQGHGRTTEGLFPRCSREVNPGSVLPAQGGLAQKQRSAETEGHAGWVNGCGRGGEGQDDWARVSYQPWEKGAQNWSLSF